MKMFGYDFSFSEKFRESEQWWEVHIYLALDFVEKLIEYMVENRPQ